MNKPHITIENASLSYLNRIIFSNVNLNLMSGQWVALLGASGVGKTSFLRYIAGLTQHGNSERRPRIHGKVFANNGAPINQQIAYMAQTDLLLPWLNVLDNATLGYKLRHTSRQLKLATRLKAKLLLERVGLEHFFYKYPHELSGGMRQRVALIRTLIEDKPFVLMDEPFSSLDAITRYQLHELAVDLLKNKTVLFITHDPSEALRLAHEIYIMQPYPAPLKLVANLTSPIPRVMTDGTIIKLQELLFTELLQK